MGKLREMEMSVGEVRDAEEVENELKDFTHLAENVKSLESIIEKGGQELEDLKNVMESEMAEILSGVKDMQLQAEHTAEKFAKNAKKGEEAIETAKTAEKKSSLFKKIMPGKKALLAAGIVAGAYLYHEGSDTYEEAKLECQETCQGFNNKNISDLKYDQLVNLLYCRDKIDIKKPCSSFHGGGPLKGVINLNKCPSECSDLRGSLRTDTSDPKNDPEKSHINSMLYGSCSLTGKNMLCEYPLILDGKGNKQSFGIIPLGKGATEDTFDNKFKDPWDGYAAVKAAAVVEIGAGGAAVGAGAAATGIGKVLDNVPIVGSAGLGGAASAAMAKAYIPDSFPGHCLNKLFENYTNEDPNTVFSKAFGDSGGLKYKGDYKYIKLCKNASSDNSSSPTPNDDGTVKKCDLITGEIKTDGSGTSSDTGSCIAWKKSSSTQGKCLPTMHSFSSSTVKEDIKEDFKYFGSDGGESTGCLNISQESDCNNHTYCYWTEDGPDTGLDNFYFCINDNSLIDIHNGILNNVSITESNKDHLLINKTSTDQSVENSIDKDNLPLVKSLSKYSGGGVKKEIDIGDICNNYCSNSLCHEPYISMALMPGVTHALDAIKTAFLIFIKIIISLVIGLILYNNSTGYKRLVFIVSMVFMLIILQFSPVSKYFDQTVEPNIVDPLVDQFINSDISEELLIGVFSFIILGIVGLVFISTQRAKKAAAAANSFVGPSS